MSAFIKNLSFPTPAHLGGENLLRLLSAMMEMGGSGAMWRMAAFVGHVRTGAQMWVSHQVSDDLLATNIEAPDFSDIPWPHPRLEVVFEDPDIPSFLIQRGPRRDMADDIQKWTGCPRIEVFGSYKEADAMLTDIVTEQADGTIASVCLNDEDLNAFARGEEIVEHEGVGDENLPMTDDETIEMRGLALMAFKVLMFAASEGFEPKVTMEPPTKRQGGKPGFKNRPRTKRFVVCYLPRHLEAKKKAAKKAADEAAMRHHAFNGRNGHLRVYRDARYVNAQGKRQFQPPIPGPDGTVPRRKFKVAYK